MHAAFAAHGAMHAAQTLPLPSDSAALALPTLSPPVSQGSNGIKRIDCIKRETRAEGAAAPRAVHASALRARQPWGCTGIAKPPFVHTCSTPGARTRHTRARCTHAHALRRAARAVDEPQLPGGSARGTDRRQRARPPRGSASPLVKELPITKRTASDWPVGRGGGGRASCGRLCADPGMVRAGRGCEAWGPCAAVRGRCAPGDGVLKGVWLGCPEGLRLGGRMLRVLQCGCVHSRACAGGVRGRRCCTVDACSGGCPGECTGTGCTSRLARGHGQRCMGCIRDVARSALK